MCQYLSKLKAHLSTNEELQREGCEHVQSETEPCDVDKRVVLAKQHVFKVIPVYKPREERTAEKLFKMFPCVLSVKTRYPEIASVQHATSDTAVEMCVTFAKRSSVGVRMLP